MAGTSGAIKAGRAFVELFLENNKFYRSLDQASSRLKATGGMWAKIGAGMGVAGASVGAPLLKVLGDAASRGADVKQLADRFNLTTQSVSALAYAFESVGAPFEEFAGTLDGLGAKMASAADGNDELFRKLGLHARVLIDLPLDKQLDAVADAFAKVANPIDRANVAQDLFGASGLKLLPVLQNGAAGIRALKTEAGELGYVLDPETAKRGQDKMKGLNATWMAFKSVLLEVGSALLPTTEEIREFVATARGLAAGIRDWVKQNKSVIVTVALVAAGLVAGGAALAAFGAIASGVGAAIGVVVLVVKALVATVALLLNPVGLVIAAIVVLGSQTESAGQVLDHFRELLGNVKEVALETFSGIVAALKKGDLEGAMKIAGAGITAVWAEVMLSLRKGWNDFVKWMVGFLKNNPWVLPAIGAAIGFAVGGPAGALAGAAAGGLGALAIHKFGDEIVSGLSIDLTDATRKVKEARAELKALVGAAKEPGGPGGPGAGAKREYDGKRIEQPPPLYGATKGVFSGPIAQQLAYGDQVQKRQLDAIVGVQKEVAKVGAIIAGLPLAAFK